MEQYVADIYFLILTDAADNETVYSDHQDVPVIFATIKTAMQEGKSIVDMGFATGHAAINLQGMIAHGKRWIERER